MEKSCWWQEAGRCYAGPRGDGNHIRTEKLPGQISSHSTEHCLGICDRYLNKRKAIEKLMPPDKLIITSEKV